MGRESTDPSPTSSGASFVGTVAIGVAAVAGASAATDVGAGAGLPPLNTTIAATDAPITTAAAPSSNLPRDALSQAPAPWVCPSAPRVSGPREGGLCFHGAADTVPEGTYGRCASRVSRPTASRERDDANGASDAARSPTVAHRLFRSFSRHLRIAA